MLVFGSVRPQCSVTCVNWASEVVILLTDLLTKLFIYLLVSYLQSAHQYGTPLPPQVISTDRCQWIWPTYAVIGWLTKTRTAALSWLV